MKDKVEKLIIALGDKDCNVRWKAVYLLGEMGPTAVELLIRVLRDGRWGGRFGDNPLTEKIEGWDSGHFEYHE